jgi:glycosyltransferase involved in cell wall biosynthesis
MNEKHLHIICHDVPYPPDYGGVVDQFYKIKALFEQGIRIHLHCYEYGRGRQAELNKYCHEVNYYLRREGHKGFSHKLPYIVCSRTSQEMLDRLLMDDYPILLEGIHCTYLLLDDRFRLRKVVLRLHNTEYEYYRQLFRSERSLFRKLYYWHESRMLKRYEKMISNKVLVLALAEQDVELYKSAFAVKSIAFLPVFVPSGELHCRPGQGCYCLYHGNLAVAENEKAALWLIQEVFNDLNLPLVIAGRKPSPRLEKMANQSPHTCLVADPSEEEMQDIIGKAQVHVIPSFNCTGTKLKLLNALFNGRHCVADEETVMHSPLKSLCHIGVDANAFKHIITEIYERPFTTEEINCRKKVLQAEYNNEQNAKKLIRWIW